MTDNKSTEADLEQGHYWTQWGASGQWEVMYWRDGSFWDSVDAGFARDKFVVGPRVFSPDEQRQIDAYLVEAVRELRPLDSSINVRNAIRLIEAAHAPTLDAIDNALADEAKAESAGAPTMPDDLVGKMLAGEMHPLKAWRTAAGLTQETLAFMAGISIIVVDLIESEPRYNPPYRVVRNLATALGLDSDDIMPM